VTPHLKKTKQHHNNYFATDAVLFSFRLHKNTQFRVKTCHGLWGGTNTSGLMMLQQGAILACPN